MTLGISYHFWGTGLSGGDGGGCVGGRVGGSNGGVGGSAGGEGGGGGGPKASGTIASSSTVTGAADWTQMWRAPLEAS